MAPLLLFAVALAARVLGGSLFGDPAYPDSYYYVNVARELAAGHGFSVDYIWNFVDVGGRLPVVGELPIPSNGHWMPLAALVQVPFIWLLGPSTLASALPFWLIGAAAAPLAYAIGMDAGLSRSVSITAGLLTAIPAAVLPFMTQPDNFGLYVTLGATVLWMAARTLRGDRRALVAGGLVVGLAALSRSDGLLLGAPLGLAALVALGRSSFRRADALAMAGSLGLFLVVVVPWLARQASVFGSVAPSAASGRILWLSDYGQLWSVAEPPTPASLLLGGLEPLLSSRLDGLVAALLIFVVAPLSAVLVVPALVGGWRHRRDAAFAPFFVFGALFLISTVVLFAVHVRYGMFLHSLVALLPHTFLLTAAGAGYIGEWIARHRPTWQAPTAAAFLRSAAVIVALLAGTLQTVSTVAAWQSNRAPRETLSTAIGAIPAGERLMSGDPGAYRYLFARPGIVTPNDPLPVIERAARAYDVRWLVLESDGIVAALAPVLRGETAPAWLSPPLAVVAAAPGEPPRAALYAVCTLRGDIRCAR